MIFSSSHRGYAFLVTVLVLGGIAASAVVTLLLLGTSVLRNTLSLQSASRAQSVAQSCAERVLLSLRTDLGYAGDETLTLPDGSECDVLPIGGSGNTSRIVCVEAQDQGVIRRMEITVAAVLPTTRITRWHDVSSFSLCSP